MVGPFAPPAPARLLPWGCEHATACSLFLLCLQDAARKGTGKLTADVQMYAVTAEEVAKSKGLNYVDMYNNIMAVKNWEVSVTESHPHDMSMYYVMAAFA